MYRNSRDSRYVSELLGRYTHLLSIVCMQYLKNPADCEDAIMDIFEKLTVILRQQKIENFKGWLFIVAKNYCLKKLGKDKKTVRLETDPENPDGKFMEFASPGDLDGEFFKKEQLTQLKKGMETLPDDQKKCITLFYLEEKSYKEVSAMTGYPVNQVKSSIQNGKRNLRIFFKKNK